MRRKYSPDIQGTRSFSQLPEQMSKDKDTQDQMRRLIQSMASKRDLKKMGDDVTRDIAEAVSDVSTGWTMVGGKMTQSGTTSVGDGAASTPDFDTSEFDSGGVVDTANDKLVIPSVGYYLLVFSASYTDIDRQAS